WAPGEGPARLRRITPADELVGEHVGVFHDEAKRELGIGGEMGERSAAPGDLAAEAVAGEAIAGLQTEAGDRAQRAIEHLDLAVTAPRPGVDDQAVAVAAAVAHDEAAAPGRRQAGVTVAGDRDERDGLFVPGLARGPVDVGARREIVVQIEGVLADRAAVVEADLVADVDRSRGGDDLAAVEVAAMAERDEWPAVGRAVPVVAVVGVRELHVHQPPGAAARSTERE